MDSNEKSRHVLFVRLLIDPILDWSQFMLYVVHLHQILATVACAPLNYFGFAVAKGSKKMHPEQ